jgi:hypothetical protein
MRIVDKIKGTLKAAFTNQLPQAAASIDLSGMNQPGLSAKKPAEITLPAVVPAAPVSVIEPVIAAPVAESITPAPVSYCLSCGQALPPKIAAATQDVPQPVVAPQSPLDAEWNDYERNDLSPRTSSQIQILLPLETEELRMKRIINDKIRYAHQQGR